MRDPRTPAAGTIGGAATGTADHAAANGADVALPLDDPALFAPSLDLDGLRLHWAQIAARQPIGAEQMRGTDVRAQRMGVPSELLMEQAGAAVAAAATALLVQTERAGSGTVLILCGPGNNGGDGLVAARHLAAHGHRCAAVLVATESGPTTRDARAAWERLADIPGVDRLQALNARDVSFLAAGVEKAALVIDALLGTGVTGPLRDPIRSAVDLTWRGRTAAVPVLAVDTPTAVDLTSGQASDPVVRADVTITFHRPKLGLLTRTGRSLAGLVLVAPIGIPAGADIDG
jgi:ADP-dependent NAD(P)H-hydrate dehydratase / NAD(P)H-hydrate epimerase